MERRKFLGVSLGGGLGWAGMSFSPAGAAASEEEKYAVMRDENREFTEGLPFRVVGQHAQFPLPKNGRQLARRGDGLWFFTYASHTYTIAHHGGRAAEGEEGTYSSATDIRMRASEAGTAGNPPAFGREEVLVGQASGYTGPTPRTRDHVIAGEAADEVGTQPSMVIDAQGRLHLVWVRPGVGEVWYARCDVSGAEGAKAIGRTDAWRHADGEGVGGERLGEEEADLGDICLDGQGRPCVLYRNRNGIWLARYDGKWRQSVVAEGKDLRWPIMACDRAGIIHVVWSGEGREGSGLLHYLRSQDGGEQWVGADGRTHAPDFIGGYCSEAPSLAVAGKDILVAHYQGYRVITYSRYDGRQWRENTVLQGTYDHNNPMLTVDGHEVVWMHMVSPYAWTRTTRWLGEEWGDLQEGRHLDNMADACSAERVMSAEAGEFGVILADRHHRLFFDTTLVPAPTTAKGQHVMFLDLWDVARLEGVEQIVDPLEKDPRNPLLKYGEAGSWDAEQVDFEGTILKEGDKYRLWYTGVDAKPFFPFHDACGYAESTDGVHWTKPDLGLYEYKGSKHNNICYPWGFQYAILRMPEELESDPAKRYRIAVTSGSGASLAYSPDGIRWTLSEENPLWSRGEPGSFHENIAENATYIYDPFDPDPERRFKAYPQTVGAEKERSVGLMISPDGIHFKPYANNPVIDPALGAERQNHYLKVCWRRHGMFIGLYGCYLENVNVDARLVVSRDGVHWVRVKRDLPFLPTGAPGSWDGGMVFPVNYPMIQGEDVWIYYNGAELTFAGGEGHASAGRARVRLDGFGKMRLRAGRSEGTLTTVALQARELDRVRLHLNVEQRTGEKGSLRVEVLDGGTGQTLPGYSAEECHPVTSDGIALPVSWQQREDLRGIQAPSVRLRFHFSGSDDSPRLCSFGFE